MIQYQKMPRYPPKCGKNNSGSVGKPGTICNRVPHINLVRTTINLLYYMYVRITIFYSVQGLCQ